MLILGAAMTGSAQTSSHENKFEEEPGMVQARQDYFYKQRAYPVKHIPEGARLRALEQVKRLKTAAEIKAVAPVDTWRQLGTGRIIPAQGAAFGGAPSDSGRVTALAVDQTNKDIVYLGAAGGGVWKTTNGGDSWTPLTDSQASLAVGSIAIDPTNDQTIYVGTGEENNGGDNYYGAGILKSTDGGNTWTLLGGGTGGTFSTCASGAGSLESGYSGAYIGALAVNPGNNQTILAAVQNCPQSGVFISNDGGSTWTAVAALSGSAPGTAVMWVNATTAYAALGNFGGNAANGIYESTDTGVTWAPANGMAANTLPSGINAGRIALVAAASNPSVLYATVTQPGGQSGIVGLYTTTDGGLDWSLTTAPNYCTSQCFYDVAMAVSPVNPNLVYGTGIYNYDLNMPTTVIGSADGGMTWTLDGSSTGGDTPAVHTDGHALAFSADGLNLYVGSDGGVWRTNLATDPTKLNWETRNDTLFTTQFYPGFVYDGKGEGIGGTQDNGTQVLIGTPVEWNNVTCGDGGFSAIDTTTGTFYAACTYSQGIGKTTTPGNVNSWTSVVTGINTKDPALFIPPMVMDPSNPSTLYYGTNQVYQTTNGGASWASISPQPLPGSTGKISAITVAPSQATTIYAGTEDSQVVVTTNGGANWTNVATTGLPARYVTHITVNPTTPTTAYATYSGFSGFNGDTLGHIFMTTNGGTSWTDVSGDLPNIPVNDLVLDPVIANTLYAATDLGVFTSSNGGTNWTPLGTGMPNVAVLALVHEPNTRTLAAATHGRGAWRIKLPNK
jgi:hypothetical protein